jgi:hypothetical protein
MNMPSLFQTSFLAAMQLDQSHVGIESVVLRPEEAKVPL